jgi:hypothetical protein
LHGLYEHPLGPVFDALTVFSAAASGAVRAGGVLAKAEW